MSKEIAKAKNNEVAVDTVPAWAKTSAAPRGSEHVTKDDLVVPRLELIQALSPARKRNDPAYIEGAEEGMLYNNVTRELYGTDAVIVPVAYRKEFLIWKDRNSGGGFRGAYQSMDEANTVVASLEDGSECEVVDTAQHFCLLMHDDGRVEEIVLSMSRTKMKCSRKLNSLIRLTEMDAFAKQYKVSAVSATNAKNQEYYTIDVAAGGFVEEHIFRRAEAMWKTIEAGNMKVSTEYEADSAGSTEF